MTDGSGRMDGATHLFPVRVYFEDTDAAGIVYHARFLHFAERARTEMLRLFGLDHGRLWLDRGLAFAVVRAVLDCRHPARLDDRLELRTRPLRLGGATIEVEQTVMRPAADGAATEIARMDIRLGCMTRHGRAGRIPADWRAVLKTFVTESRTDHGT